MVVLKNVMRPDMYAMFIDLVVSMRILNDEDGVHSKEMVNYAIHLADDVRRFKKPLCHGCIC